MSIIRDEYILGQSVKKSITDIAEAIRIDLSLNPNPHINSGSVTGIVKDTMGNLISDAVVLILDQAYGIIANTITGNDGRYNFPNISAGSGYRAYAQAPGFSIAEAIPFKLSKNQIMEIDFALISDTADIRSVIAGEVLNTNGLPISSASIELYKIEEHSTRLLCLSFSNNTGQFVLRDLSYGKYFLKINATGYFSDYFPVDINKPKTIARVETVLREDLKASKGIIMGIITDNDEVALANADVVLYRVGINKALVPVAYTRTNHEGIYIFINIPKGEYLVNSTRSVILD